MVPVSFIDLTIFDIEWLLRKLVFLLTVLDTMAEKSSTYPEYTEDQLKAALNSLMEGSSDPDFDGRHLFGFKDGNHKLSKLQSITATRVLDYEAYMVRSRSCFVFEEENQSSLEWRSLLSS